MIALAYKIAISSSQGIKARFFAVTERLPYLVFAKGLVGADKSRKKVHLATHTFRSVLLGVIFAHSYTLDKAGRIDRLTLAVAYVIEKGDRVRKNGIYSFNQDHRPR